MKIRKYKIGDKVILLKDKFGYYINDIGIVVKLDKPSVSSDCLINVPGRISTSCYNPNVVYTTNEFEYYYEKPLNDLHDKLNEMFFKISHHSNGIVTKDFNIITNFINKKETLTDKEIKQCALIWEKYKEKNEK